MSARQAVADYIRAKDLNRPHLMRSAFTEGALLKMVVNTGAISFPPEVAGRDGIADVLVRRFGQTYENVYTFCLTGEPPPHDAAAFSCGWLVGMSGKADGEVRVGCGRYDWVFEGGDGVMRASRLTIAIEEMAVLPAEALRPVMDWLSALPPVWCGACEAFEGAPGYAALEPVKGRCRLWAPTMTQQPRRIS